MRSLLLAVGAAVGVLSWMPCSDAGEAPKQAAPNAAVPNQSKPPRFSDVRKLDAAALRLPGVWESRKKLTLISSEVGGGTAKFRYRPTGEDKVTVEAGIMEAVFSGAAPCVSQPPTDCRLMLRWVQETRAVDWSMDLVADRVRGDDLCSEVTEEEGAPSVEGVPAFRRTRARFLIGTAKKRFGPDTVTEPAGVGTIEIKSDGSVTLDASDRPRPDEFHVFVVKELATGNLYFWVE